MIFDPKNPPHPRDPTGDLIGENPALDLFIAAKFAAPEHQNRFKALYILTTMESMQLNQHSFPWYKEAKTLLESIANQRKIM